MSNRRHIFPGGAHFFIFVFHPQHFVVGRNIIIVRTLTDTMEAPGDISDRVESPGESTSAVVGVETATQTEVVTNSAVVTEPKGHSWYCICCIVCLSCGITGHDAPGCPQLMCYRRKCCCNAPCAVLGGCMCYTCAKWAKWLHRRHMVPWNKTGWTTN